MLLFKPYMLLFKPCRQQLDARHTKKMSDSLCTHCRTKQMMPYPTAQKSNKVTYYF